MAHTHYNALAVANTFLELARYENSSITPMKLQKLVYYAHAWSLVIFNEPLINETIRAWKYGPVIDSIYHDFKCFGSQPINILGTVYDTESDRFSIPVVHKSDTQFYPLIKKVWQEYEKFSALELSTMTHAKGSAWEVTKQQHQNGSTRGFVLKNDLIKKCLEKKMQWGYNPFKIYDTNQ